MPVPDNITFKRRSNVLLLQYGDHVFSLGAEFLRVHSPSAEVRGHGPGQHVLQYGKQGVLITGIEQLGNYALKILYSDGHDSGIYSWDYLYELGSNQDQLWQAYLDELNRAGKPRDPSVSAVKILSPDQ